ncbi:MAG: ribosome maturation factor RimM [Prevotellaceae bacterium]|jgi:16S rRNA processing protein RimM|nr:ribosome maturation factor RimM [Prevotellaceae bacterium]
MKQAHHLRQIGDVLKTFGTNGELIVKIREDIPQTILKNREPVFIYMDGLSVPFYMKAVEPKGVNKLVVVFEDMETETLATELIGKQVYMVSKKSDIQPNGEFDVLIGFVAIDERHGELGMVKEIMDIPGNPCLVVNKQEQEVIIPLNEDLIISIDTQKQQIHLDIPDGLLDLFLE